MASVVFRGVSCQLSGASCQLPTNRWEKWVEPFEVRFPVVSRWKENKNQKQKWCWIRLSKKNSSSSSNRRSHSRFAPEKSFTAVDTKKLVCFFLSLFVARKTPGKREKEKKYDQVEFHFLVRRHKMRFFFIEIWIKLVEMRRRRRCWRFRKTLFSTFHSRFVFVWWSLKIFPGSLKKFQFESCSTKTESLRMAQMIYFWLYPIR